MIVISEILHGRRLIEVKNDMTSSWPSTSMLAESVHADYKKKKKKTQTDKQTTWSFHKLCTKMYNDIGPLLRSVDKSDEILVTTAVARHQSPMKCRR